MTRVILVLGLFLPVVAWAQEGSTTSGAEQIQSQPRPAYCEPPANRFAAPKGGTPLPRSNTRAVICYKVQVAILRQSDPYDFPFHEELTARWRPCEEVWVIESRLTFCDRRKAEQFREKMLRVGYEGAFITKLIGYRPQ